MLLPAVDKTADGAFHVFQGQWRILCVDGAHQEMQLLTVHLIAQVAAVEHGHCRDTGQEQQHIDDKRPDTEPPWRPHSDIIGLSRRVLAARVGPHLQLIASRREMAERDAVLAFGRLQPLALIIQPILEGHTFGVDKVQQ